MDLDISTHPVVCDMVDYQGKYCNIDTPGKSLNTINDFNSSPIQDFSYNFNSWGYRDQDFQQYIGKKVNLCIGDSMTLNFGGPATHSWPSQLAKRFHIPTLNFGMASAGNDAMLEIHSKLAEIFDVQNVFVMYSYFHRRFLQGNFTKSAWPDDNENFVFFKSKRLKNCFECALPSWCWTQEEKQFLRKQKIYFLDMPYVSLFKDYQTMDRKFIVKDVYERLQGPDWPTVDQFVKGADPHPDMFTENFGRFVSTKIYTNRDGHHLNFEANEIYANYLYQQWKQNNES